ncbi:MAG: PIG-L family deacetylase [Saprospiraceae bacterium]|nr:PIG-L family deacetylase [Saprospiraceae bacterium]
MKIIKRTLLVGCIAILHILKVQSQAPLKPTSGEIYNRILQLQRVGTVMYLAAHPDDENTRLITWLSNKQHINTVYLSLTRGDGGQNLIGTQTGDLLGILRTQELLMARRVDGGKQWFTRANDFGFSKKALETLRIWDKREVLSDVVAAIRYWQPDIIINRFPSDTTVQTHGHHTASAILSLEAFDLTNDASSFPESAAKYGVWQAKRIYFNTSYFFYKSQAEFEKADKSTLANLEIGDYYPILGKSNNEISAESRSMHKCQAFGSIGNRNEQKEYLELLKGQQTANKDDIFEGLNLSWSRLKGGENVSEMIQKILNNYKFENPASSVSELLNLYKYINQNVENSRKKDQKLEELKEIIGACSGLFLEVVSSEPISTRSSEVKLKIELTNRSNQNITLKRIMILPFLWDSIFNNETIKPNKNFMREVTGKIPSETSYTGPYWVENRPSNGMYKVINKDLIGLPETPRELKTVFSVQYDDQVLEYTRTIVYKYEDPVKGEIYTPFDIVPDVYVNPMEEVVLFPDKKSKTISVKITAARDNIEGTLSLGMNRMWSVTNNVQKFVLAKKGEEKILSFTINPSEEDAETAVTFEAKIGSFSINQSLIEIAYDHIPTQRVIKPAYARLIREDIKCKPVKIAYLPGPGDKVPEALLQLGINVQIIKPENLTSENLSKFNVLITGIRAYNTVTLLGVKRNELLKFMEEGGTIINQYNTNYDLVTKEIGPYPFNITKGRVTDENAPMFMQNVENPILNQPNKIDARDFDAWVQERGLYFVSTEDQHYKNLIKTNDPGEAFQEGSLIYCPYGKGHYVYCALSLFRQLPAGVPGAYKLLANMLSLGNNTQKP